MRARRLGMAVAVAVLAATAGCGVPTGGEPTVVERSAVPYGLLDPAEDPAGVPSVALAPGAGEVGGQVALLTADDHIRLVTRVVTAGAPDAVAQALLDALEAGPTDAERTGGLRSALPPDAGLTVAGLEDGVVSVDIAALDSSLTARLQQTVGQVVLTVTSVRGVSGVRLQLNGNPVAAPDAGGPLTSAPLTRADFAPLLRPSPPRTP